MVCSRPMHRWDTTYALQRVHTYIIGRKVKCNLSRQSKNRRYQDFPSQHTSWLLKLQLNNKILGGRRRNA
ncbi:hypothetical protein PgNI_11206 [Pyricularia grisea]|uniref:Uncharacterized protein n=1 Tax=Pyricularia grisea TaxID=148305 RepID=A0A6P8AQ32_PYRGI|nr:hypothetical protein PgNI_11206 [Pyricularia grisea]TLD04154.1 hypothetical protein PgNI_11206 [Pyricularia grisea]